MIRHLERRHDGVDVPLNQNDFAPKMYEEFANQEPSLSPTAVASSIAAASLSSAHKQEKNNDPYDHILPALRKVAEFKNLLSELSFGSQGIPISARLRMLLVIASLTHLEIPPTPNLFASMMTNSKLSAIADMHLKVV